MTHALVGNGTSGARMPLWLNEGISMLSEPDRVALDATKRYLSNRTRGAGLALSEVVRLGGYPEAEGDLRSFYDGAAALTRYLARQKGRAAVLAAARKTRTTAALLQALDAPPPDVVEASVRAAFESE